MEEQNIIVTLSQNIPLDLTASQEETLLLDYLSNVIRTNIYSYIVYKRYRKDIFVGWCVKYNVSCIQKYNTLTHDTIVSEIMLLFSHTTSEKQRIIGYHQPDIALMLKVYDPLVKRYAAEQSNHWTVLEYEDAYVMCQLCMHKLYLKGYYIHKDLLKRCFNRDVLYYLRQFNDDKFTISIEDLILHNTAKDTDITYDDILEDKTVQYERENKEDNEESMMIFNRIKKFCISIIGERQFEQLFNEYGNQCTTAWSRKKMNDLKKMCAWRNITRNSFK